MAVLHANGRECMAMRSALLVGALMLAGAADARAMSWSFSFSPLCGFTSCVSLEGTFSGEDRDHDGVLRLDELVSLVAGGTSYFPARAEHHPSFPELDTGWGTSRFSYVIGGPLDFATSEAGYHYMITIDVGTAWTFGNIGDTYLWSADTVQHVQALTVPEPAALGLAALGLPPLLSAVRRRRRSLG